MNPLRESYRSTALLLAEEGVCGAEDAMRLPLRIFLDWVVRIEKRLTDRADALRQRP